MSIEAMKQALDALDTCQWDYDYEEEPYKTFDDDLVNNATEALRQAIEQAEKQEPVAWLVRDYVDGFRYVSSTENPSGTIAGLSEPLYTAPPKQDPVAWRKKINGVWHYFDESTPFPFDDCEPLYEKN
jgi:hypothetical protein